MADRDAASEDARPKLAGCIMSDIIHMLSYQIMQGGQTEKALERYKALNYFSQKYLTGQERKEGQSAILRRLSNSYVVACLADPYGDLHPNTDGEGVEETTPLYQMNLKQWNGVRKALTKTRDILMGPEDADSPLFNKRFHSIIQLIKVQEGLCSFRQTLEEQIRRNDEGSLHIDTSVVKVFSESIDAEEDDRVKEALQSLLRRNEDTPGKTRSGGIYFKPIPELKAQLSVKPFCLHTLQKKLRFLYVTWMDDCCGGKQPTLFRLGYADLAGIPDEIEAMQEASSIENSSADEEEAVRGGDTEEHNRDSDEEGKKPAAVAFRERKPEEEEVQQQLQGLKEARNNLQNDVEDPLEECEKIAATAGRTEQDHASPSRGGGLYKRKKTATKIVFSPGDDISEEMGQPTLSHLPQYAKIRTPQNPVVEPDHPELNAQGKRKRRRFTEDEKTAIRQGVRNHGFGKWAAIKAEFSVVLRNRTSVNIKDCYRTMMKHNEV